MRFLMIALLLFSFPAMAEEPLVHKTVPSEIDRLEKPKEPEKSKMSMDQAAKELNLDVPEPDSKDKKPCARLAYSIYKCENYGCVMPAEANNGFKTAHAILGKTRDGRFCRHQQTLPDGNMLECAYTPAMQVVLARMTIFKTELDEEEKAAMAESFKKQCRIMSAPKAAQ